MRYPPHNRWLIMYPLSNRALGRPHRVRFLDIGQSLLSGGSVLPPDAELPPLSGLAHVPIGTPLDVHVSLLHGVTVLSMIDNCFQ
jgi:hypothetical protein